ncbi:MAG: IS630 family transposase [bacterium]
MLHGWVLPAVFPPLQRAQIQAIVCAPPADYNLNIIHWSVRDLATTIVEKNVVTSIHYSTVCLILQASEFQPHRSRYWMTSMDPEFVSKSAKVLWCYERAKSLANKGEAVLCVDEKPALQVFERAAPTIPISPRHIERQEFHYIRHGTVNWFAALRVHDGKAWGNALKSNNHQYFLEAMDRLLYEHRDWSRIHVIMDNGPSHIHHEVSEWVQQQGRRIRLLYFPTHASWLNQAEILLHVFASKYIRRSSWDSPETFVDHLYKSNDEYNQRLAEPFN